MRICLYVPVNSNGGKTGADLVKEIVNNLCTKLGGATVSNASGYHCAGDGALVEEPVYVVEAFSTDIQAVMVAHYQALVVKHAMQQTSAAYAIDGQMFLV